MNLQVWRSWNANEERSYALLPFENVVVEVGVAWICLVYMGPAVEFGRGRGAVCICSLLYIEAHVLAL